MDSSIEQAISIVKQGGVIIYPTDTAFGIGCRIDDEQAIKRLFKIRKRPETQATPVLTASLHMVGPYIKPVNQDIIDRLLTPYWPGALTVVLPGNTEAIPELVRGGTDTIGIRVPDHLTTLEILSGVGVPILGPSANFHGESTPYRFEDLDPALVALVDFVVPGVCHTKQASTVIDTTQTPWKMLRQGAIRIKE